MADRLEKGCSINVLQSVLRIFTSVCGVGPIVAERGPALKKHVFATLMPYKYLAALSLDHLILMDEGAFFALC